MLCQYSFYERITMRVLFALVVFRAQQDLFAVQPIIVPNGLARLVPLDFLLSHPAIRCCEILFVLALGLYVCRIGLGFALPVLTLISIAYGSLSNSQGAISHSYQIVSLVLLAQIGAHFYGGWRGGGSKSSSQTSSGLSPAEDRLIFWSQQAIAATYLVSGLTKVIKTQGMWLATSPAIALQIVKSTDQLFYNTLDPKVVAGASAAANLVIQHPFTAMLFLGAGLFLELGAPLMVYNRLWGLSLGFALVIFHRTIGEVMGLHFIYNEYLVLIYFVNAPYWIVTLGQKLYPHVRRLVQL
jgi:hypothetical protein